MPTKAELQKQITELEAALAKAEIVNQISRGLNTALDEDELLQVLAQPAIEAGACYAALLYVDLDEVGEPEWNEIIAIWQREGEPAFPVGARYYLPEFPGTRSLWMVSQSEPQLIADTNADERVDKHSRGLMSERGLHSMAIIPLSQAGRWVGFLNFHWERPQQFSEQEVEIYRALIGLGSPAVASWRLLVEKQEERMRLQQEVIEAQRQALQELSTPIIPIMDRIIVMPLIGSIDTLRAKDIMRALLAGIREHRARVVILDITGVPIVDSGVANHLNKTIQAARLKGARTIVTGISDAVAEAIVDLGIDWSGIETLSNLQTGLMVALSKVGRRIEG